MMEDQSVFQKKISSDIENVRSALQKEIEAFSDTIVEKILGRAL
jgi:F0F1-type ATP synthase membrane subunit b/b'